MPSSPPSDPALDAKLRLLVESYERLTGKALIDDAAGDGATLREALWRAPFAIVAHGNEADPVFFYGNAYALRCFEMEFDEFVHLPSRLSAEPVNQAARDEVLRRVAERGYIEGYSGMRIARTGRRFMIAKCAIWNLIEGGEPPKGQAAMFVAQ